jgi:hypothetical protein
MINEQSKLEEIEFQNKWIDKVDKVVQLSKQLQNDFAKLLCSLENLGRLKELFTKIYYKCKTGLSDELDDNLKFNIISFHTRNYASILLMSLDDVMFLKNGRILTTLRKNETSQQTIHPKIVNWFHNEFDSQARPYIPLCINCVDHYLKLRSDCANKSKAEWASIEVRLIFDFNDVVWCLTVLHSQ